jgi:hypothetical protein
LFGLEAGQHVCLALPLSDQLRTGLALRVDGIEGTVGPAALRHLRDCPVNLGKPRVDIGERVRSGIDSGPGEQGIPNSTSLTASIATAIATTASGSPVTLDVGPLRVDPGSAAARNVAPAIRIGDCKTDVSSVGRSESNES